MSSGKSKYIGIETRVNFDLLEAAVADYIQNGVLDKEKCINHIKQYTKGANRVGKVFKHITVLLNKNEDLLVHIRKYLKAVEFYQLGRSERRTIILCLFCIAYPITYDIVSICAKAFKLQDKINKQVITDKIGAIYGSNRAMHISVVEIIPLLIECDLIKRVKVGIYSAGSKIIIRDKFLAELVVYTDIFLSKSNSILMDDIAYKPWFSIFDLSTVVSTKFSHLITIRDGAVGKGYLTITH